MEKKKVIALVGNPNSGKTTLFNQLTGSNQYVGNWPGVTVEKKEGKLRDHNEVIITDLPGIYSLSPYTLEEVIARDYLVKSKPDAILNIVDGTNLERNLYLSTQLIELGIPMIIAINLMDIVRKNCDFIDIKQLSFDLGVPIIEISALKNENCLEAAHLALEQIGNYSSETLNIFSRTLENTLNHIEHDYLETVVAENKRWLAIKLFERDPRVLKRIDLDDICQNEIETAIQKIEDFLDDDAESIIANERYLYITRMLRGNYCKGCMTNSTTSDKIDNIVTNRFLAFPIFVLTMFLVYFLSISTVGTWATDWTNDGLFGDGFHLLNIGDKDYQHAVENYKSHQSIVEGYEQQAEIAKVDLNQANNYIATVPIYDDEGIIESTITVNYSSYLTSKVVEEPDPENYGVYLKGIPVVVEETLNKWQVAPWLVSLIVNGVIGGVGAVLGFVPQMAVLFLLLALLEASGYMSRIAFVLDRIFRKFGLSGKSFIPMMIGTGCSVPGIMASRTIENQTDRRITILTTSFMPCSAKLPIIALIAGAFFNRAWWVAPSAYFIGVAAILVTGIILKKTKMFAGDVSPFVMELPEYRWPKMSNVIKSVLEKTWAFISKAGTIILVSSVVLWFLMNFGFEPHFGMVENIEASILAVFGNFVSSIFAPLGFGSWQATVATVTGLIAKENVVGTFGVLFSGMEEVAENGWQVWEAMRLAFTPIAAFSFLIFNLLCTPCIASVGAITREMNNRKYTWFALAYQVGFAYAVSFVFYQLALFISGQGNYLEATIGGLVLIFGLYLIFRPAPSNDENPLLVDIGEVNP